MTCRRLNCVQLLSVCGLVGLGLALGPRPAPSAPPPPPPPKPTFTYQSLGTLGGATSTAEGINDLGDVVGVSDLSGGGSSPYVWTTGEGMQDLNVLTEGAVKVPSGLRFGPDRNGDGIDDLYVACRGNSSITGSVSIFDGIDGRFVEQFISPGSGGLAGPSYFCFGPDGHVYIPSKPAGMTSGPNTRVLKFDGASGQFFGEFVNSTNGGPSRIAGLAFGIDQNDDGTPDLYLASEDAIVVHSGFDGVFLGTFVGAGVGGLEQPWDLGFLTDLNEDGVADLLVSSDSFDLQGDGRVLAYSGSDGSPIGSVVEPPNGTAERFNNMALGPDGSLFIVGTLTNQVYRRDSGTNELELFVAAGYGGLLGETPFITFNSSGDLFVVSENSNQVLKYQGPNAANPGEFVEIFVTGVGYIMTSARDINNAGQIVGGGLSLGRRGLGDIGAYRYTPPGPGDDIGNAVDLGLPGTSAEEATGINEDGDVAGHFVSPTDGKYHAFLWSETTGAIDLGTLSGQNTFATAITERNGSGHVQIAGYASTSSGDRAWRYNTATGVMQNLGLISGSSGASRAWDINDAGTAAGQASAGTKTHAFTRTLSGGMFDLGTLGGNNSYAAGINDLNTVVGMSDASTKAAQNKFQAFMRTSVNGMFKLEPQITNLPGSMLLKVRPTRVSDAGLVIGPGKFDPAGTAFVLTPE